MESNPSLNSSSKQHAEYIGNIFLVLIRLIIFFLLMCIWNYRKQYLRSRGSVPLQDIIVSFDVFPIDSKITSTVCSKKIMWPLKIHLQL